MILFYYYSGHLQYFIILTLHQYYSVITVHNCDGLATILMDKWYKYSPKSYAVAFLVRAGVTLHSKTFLPSKPTQQCTKSQFLSK